MSRGRLPEQQKGPLKKKNIYILDPIVTLCLYFKKLSN